jgi:taurine dioxygenase
MRTSDTKDTEDTKNAEDTRAWPFTLHRCTPTIGAEVSGVDLGNLDDTTYRALRQALLEHKVLFFRDQDITPAQHVAAARRPANWRSTR